jgi:hypothetical protein
MKKSDTRIGTTHVGSLVRTPVLDDDALSKLRRRRKKHTASRDKARMVSS